MTNCTKVISVMLLMCLVNFHVVSSLPFDSDVRYSPEVQTKSGLVRGSILKSRLGLDFFAFRGIRYAQPPIGPLRFQPPQPVEPWDDIFSATDDGPMCIQNDKPERMSEDCLRLNVYTSGIDPKRKKPVIYYLHLGGFYGLSGQSNYTVGPQLLLDSEVVLVSGNYRLGMLGFLSTGTRDATGNYGLKDQVMTLRWIRDNIEDFGGDPKSVTIMGYSAGAMSTTLHLVSPMSRGSFHRVIVMSGSTTSQWDTPSEQFALAKKQARLFGCSDDTLESVMGCLRSAKAEDYAKTVKSMFEFGGVNPIIVFKPVVEEDFGQERFLTHDPTCLMESGDFAKVEVLTGITEYEFLFPAIDILRDPALRSDMNSQFSKLAPICFLYERGSRDSENITLQLRSQFFTNSADWLDFNGLKNLFADGVIGFGVHRFAQFASKFTRVYQYQFSYTGRYSHTYYPDDKPYGAVHHDDLLYLFAVPVMVPLFKTSDPEDAMVRRMTGLWSNFASTGDPNIGEYAMQTYWPPMDTNNNIYLDINDQPSVNQNLYAQRYRVWNNLFPIENRCSLSAQHSS